MPVKGVELEMDVVIFEVAGQRLALPAASVFEVLDPLPVTPLPYAPPYVDGLVNVAGRVVVQMGASCRLALGENLAALRGSLLVVSAGGAFCAVHVERVLTKATVADSDIAQREAGSAGGIFLAGEFQWKDAPVLLLEADAFALDGIAAVGEPEGSGGLLGSAIGTGARGKLNAQACAQLFSCLIIRCNGERYGIPLNQVGEVVDEFKLTALPHAPAEISGMALLRGAPLLALSLGIMLGGDGRALQKKMVVVEKSGTRFGLLAEEVQGIESFAEGSMQAVEHGAEIEGYLIGKDGEMIGLIDLDGLISEARFDLCRNFLIRNHMAQALDQASTTARKKIRFLSFWLGSEQCAIPLALVERVEEYRDETGLPRGAEAGLSGAVQIQGEVAPVIDLRLAMGTAAEEKNAAFLVVRMEGGLWALTVNRVERVIEINESDIEQINAGKSDYVGAVGRLAGKLISIITLEPLKASNYAQLKKAA